MHAAPPVRITVGPDKVWTLLSALLGGLAGLALGSWMLALADAPPGAATAIAGLGAVLCGALGPRVVGLGQGELSWDGGGWSWTPLGRAEQVQVRPIVAFDLGPWLLLRLAPAAGGATWVAVSQGRLGPAWGSWRAALYSGAAGAPAGNSAGPEP